MRRYFGILTLSLAAVAGVNAGSLTFVGGNSGLTTVQTYGNITATSPANILPYAAQVLQGTVNNAGNYITSGVACTGYAAVSASDCTTNGGTVVNNLPYNASNPTGGEFLTNGSNGVTFAMINQSIDSSWSTSGAAASTQSITIPMGVFGVNQVYTMLNDDYGVEGGSDISVTFNFSSTGPTGSIDNHETFTLVDGTVIRDAWDCTSGTSLAACQAYQTAGHADSLDTSNAYDSTGAQTTNVVNPYVTAFNVITTTYGSLDTVGEGGTGANITAGANPYKNTSGYIFLDAQNFYLGTAYLGEYLKNIVITDTTTGASTVQSKAVLSAIDYVAPEPGTWFLLLTGIVIVGAVRYRRNAQASRSV